MNHPTHHHTAGFRWMSLLLSLILLLSGVGAGPTPQPPEPPSPALERAEQWDAAPRAPLESEPSPSAALAPADMVEFCEKIHYNRTTDSHEIRPYGLMNSFTTFIHQAYNYNAGHWEIKYSGLCEIEKGTAVASHPADETEPRLSFDATQVVFVSNRAGKGDIFATALESGAVRQLTTHPAMDAMPAFSPDGASVVFVSDRTGNPEIFVMRADGSGQTQLTYSQAVDVYPDWSPDGKHIAFIQRSGEFGRIMQMNPDGSGLTALTGHFYLPGRVRWSPTGTRLALEYDDNADTWIDIGIIDANGSGLKRVALGQKSEHRDFELGNWSIDESYLAINRVEYINYQGKWYISEAKPGLLFLPGGELFSRDYPDVAMATDIRNPDQLRPVSGVNPLPEFTHEDEKDFGSWWARDYGSARLYRSTLYFSFDGITWKYLEQRSDESDPKQEINNLVVNPTGGKGAGYTLYFRAEAIDRSGNAEVKPVQVEASTRLYRYLWQGRVLDLRGQPLNGVKISGPFLNQPVTRPDGTAGIFTAAEVTSPVNFSLGDLLPPQPQPLILEYYNKPVDYLAVMRGPEERIKNGQFDTAGLSGWAAAGRWAAAEAPGRLGGNAAAVSSLCSELLCMKEAETAGSGAMLVLDSLGQAHTLSADGVYTVRGTDGVWQTGPALPQGSYQALTMGLNDELLVIQTAPEAKLFRKPAGGEWSGLALPAPVHSASLAMDGQGKVHLAYQELVSNVRGAVWVSRLEGDQWQSQHLQDLSDGLPPAYPQIAVDSAGFEYIAYTQNVNLSYKFISLDGKITDVPYGIPGYNLQAARPVVDTNGFLHVLVREESTSPDIQSGGWKHTFLYKYEIRKKDGTWLQGDSIYSYSLVRPDANLSPLEWFGGLEVADQGNMHILLLDRKNQGSSELVYQTKRVAEQRFKQQIISLPYGASTLSVGIDKYAWGRLLLAGPAGSNYHEVALTTQPAPGGLQQTITLPATMHAPTLSLFYRIEDYGKGLEVWVLQAGKEPVLVSTGIGAYNWTHAWADLSPWLGQKITIELRLAQFPGQPSGRLYLDEVTVGSWTTPVVHSITPNQIGTLPVGGVQVRIQGDNLVEGMQVFLDGIAAKNVQYEAATGDLLFTLDRATKPGYHDVRVVAPSGVDAVVLGGLRVGQVVYLPVIKSTR